MTSGSTNVNTTNNQLSPNFRKFWVGQAISAFGNSLYVFALPLLVYKLTGSAIDLAISTASHYVPYLLFGLIIGAWVDRVDRKRLMIAADAARACIAVTVPLMASLGLLSVWWIYAAGFVSSTLGIFFESAQYTAIPSLVSKDDLVTANGRIQANNSSMRVFGPLVGGLLVVVIPLESLLIIDALTFLISALYLAAIDVSFNQGVKEPRVTNIKQDIAEGVRYVLGHAVLRNISLMMALVNFVGTTINAQRVLFAKEQLGATDLDVGILASAGSVGIVLLSLFAGRLRKYWSFSKVALGALMLNGLLTILLANTTWFVAAVPIFALMSGLGILFNINTNSLRQQIVPNHLLGRVMSIAGVVAWSANPLGAYLGGLAIEWVGDVGLVYGVIGVFTFLIPLAFSFTSLARADRYLQNSELKDTETQKSASR